MKTNVFRLIEKMEKNYESIRTSCFILFYLQDMLPFEVSHIFFTQNSEESSKSISNIVHNLTFWWTRSQNVFHLFSPFFSRVNSSSHRTSTRICESPCICIHTTNRFHVIGINYARTLCCHAGSAALDVDRGSIRPDRAIRRRDREPR